MTNAWLAAGLGAVVVLDIALLWIVLGPALARRLDERNAARRTGAADGGALDIRAIAALDPSSVLGDGVPPAAYDRVVRVASWAYLLSTAVVVYATGLWPDAEDPLLLVLAIGGIFILFAHDILPAAGLGPARFVVEGAVAITLVSIVIALTGGAASPFFYAYPLVVAGAALVVPPLVTVALAGAATAGYLVAVLVAADGTTPDTGSLATVAVNLTALALLAFVAMVVAREQRRTRDAAVRLSTIDAMTGLANRGYIIAALEREIDRATRYGHGFCVLMADLDGLKELNDTYGHRVGDRALSAVAGVIRENVRRIDTPARLGGDEFIVLLPETDRDGARVVADKIRQGVAAAGLGERGERIPLAVSIGLGEWTPGRSLDDVMAAADDAMYDVKRRVRRRPNGRTALEAIGPGRPPSAADRAAARRPGSGAGRADRHRARQELRRRLTGPTGSEGERSRAGGVGSAAMDGFTTARSAPPPVPPASTSGRRPCPSTRRQPSRRSTRTSWARSRPERRRATSTPGWATRRWMPWPTPRRSCTGRTPGSRRQLAWAAINLAVGSLVGAGDRIVATRAIYGTTRALFTAVLARFGVETVFVDAADHGAVEAALAAAPTRVLYLETISNPTIAVADLPALAALGHRHGAAVVVDNTFASPALCRPLEHGADLVVESATKYLSGHSDVLAGVVVGSRARIAAVHDLHVETGRHAGALLGLPRPARDPHACPADGAPRGDGRPPGRVPRNRRGGGARLLPDVALAPAPRRRIPPPRVRRRDARPGARRWRAGGPRLRRRPADPGTDRVVGQHPHDRRAPAVDHASPAGRGRARGGGDRPRPGPCLGGPRGR